MGDFGNDYQTDEWALQCCEWGHSTATFGFFDEWAVNATFEYGADLTQQVV